jgi:hypothetical protein
METRSCCVVVNGSGSGAIQKPVLCVLMELSASTYSNSRTDINTRKEENRGATCEYEQKLPWGCCWDHACPVERSRRRYAPSKDESKVLEHERRYFTG